MTAPNYTTTQDGALRIFSTTHALPGEGAAYWNRQINETISPAELQAADAGKFEAELKVCKLGSISIANLKSHPGTITRTVEHIRRGANKWRFCLTLHAKGLTQRSHCGHDITLRDGDFTLLDDISPFVTKYQKNTEMVLLNVSDEVLEAHLPNAERMCGLTLPAGSRLNTLIANMIQGLWREVETGLPTDCGAAIVSPLLDVVAAAYAITCKANIPGSAVTNARRAKAKRFIDENLRDPALTPDIVAQALDVTPRYLRMLFSSENETVTDYILGCRLEQCARRMSSSPWRDQSITDIAFAWGFNNASHFSNVFKKRYGMTPRDYRQRHLSQ